MARCQRLYPTPTHFRSIAGGSRCRRELRGTRGWLERNHLLSGIAILMHESTLHDGTQLNLQGSIQDITCDLRLGL